MIGSTVIGLILAVVLYIGVKQVCLYTYIHMYITHISYTYGLKYLNTLSRKVWLNVEFG